METEGRAGACLDGDGIDPDEDEACGLIVGSLSKKGTCSAQGRIVTPL